MRKLNLSVTTSHVCGLNKAVKRRQRLSDCIKRKDLTICCLQEICFKYKDKLKVKDRKRYQNKDGRKKRKMEWLYQCQRFQSTGNQDKGDVIVTENNHQECITILDTHNHLITASEHVKQTDKTAERPNSLCLSAMRPDKFPLPVSNVSTPPPVNCRKDDGHRCR